MANGWYNWKNHVKAQDAAIALGRHFLAAGFSTMSYQSWDGKHEYLKIEKLYYGDEHKELIFDFSLETGELLSPTSEDIYGY